MGSMAVALLVIQSLFLTKTLWQNKPLPDHIEIYKSKHILVLKHQGRTIASYPASFGYFPGKKVQSGDKKTPEGQYKVIGKKSKSIFTHSLHINYPNQNDREYARKLGVDPGNEITIHGTGDSKVLQKEMKALRNWTRGCIGVHNYHIKELFQQVAVGTPVDIYP